MKPSPWVDGPLWLGRTNGDSEPVGHCRVRKTSRGYTATITVSDEQLTYALSASGLTQEGGSGEPAEPTAFREAFEEWSHACVKYSVLAQGPVARMTSPEFVRWLETLGDSLDRWLGVPAVQAHIRVIRRGKSAKLRASLGSAIAGRDDGRPRRLPSSRVVYVRVRDAEKRFAKALHAWLADRRADGLRGDVIWAKFQKEMPLAAAGLRELKLDSKWFLAAERPHSQARTPWFMACEFVAARENSTPATIQKLAGKARSQRERIAKSHPKKPA